MKYYCENAIHNYFYNIFQREQLAQKKDKRKRAKTYRVIEEAYGSYLPLKHGWGVLCHPPCTDEQRIKLKVGDIVIVTRWRKYVNIKSISLVQKFN